MTCSVAGCGRPHYARGYCSLDYHRGMAKGWLKPLPKPSVADRLLPRIAPAGAGGCWEWTGARDRRGYGRIGIRGRRSSLAHRVVYEHFRGPIPEGLTLDHLCLNHGCVNPAHLEPVTQAENAGRWNRYANSLRTTCRRGHPLIRGAHQRRCYVCENAQARSRRAAARRAA